MIRQIHPDIVDKLGWYEVCLVLEIERLVNEKYKFAKDFSQIIFGHKDRGKKWHYICNFQRRLNPNEQYKMAQVLGVPLSHIVMRAEEAASRKQQ